VLLIVHPVPNVLGAIRVSVLAEPVSFVVPPESIVDVPVSVDQTAFSVSFVISPVTFVDRAVAPDLVAASVSLVCVHVPLALVLRAVLEDDHGPLLFLNSLLVILLLILTVVKFRELFTDSLDLCSLLFKFFRLHLDMNGASH